MDVTRLVKITCAHCAKSALKPEKQVNDVIRLGNKMYCNKECAGLSRRSPKTGKPPSYERVMSILSLDSETGVLRWKRRAGVRDGAIAGTLSGPHGYWQIRIDGHFYGEHRIVWLMTHGAWPALTVDHINRKPGDNRPSNLRLATRSQQVANTKLSVRNRHGVKGLHYCDGSPHPWHAYIGVSGKKKHIGCFESKEAAISARHAAALKYFGEFANESDSDLGDQ